MWTLRAGKEVMKSKRTIIDRFLHSIFALFTSVIAIYAWCSQEGVSKIALFVGIGVLTVLFILDTIFRQKDISDSVDQEKKMDSLLNEINKKPELLIEINNARLVNEITEIYEENGAFPLNIVLNNIGNRGTGEIQVYLKYASFLTLENTNTYWHFDTRGSRNLRDTSFDGMIHQNTFIWPINLLPNNWISTGISQFRLSQDILLDKIPIRLQAYYGMDSYFESVFYLKKKST
jgi:hypothetical protein